MDERIIDARNRFSRNGREALRAEPAADVLDRGHSQHIEAKRLRDEFKAAPLFNEQDRKTLVRNLGRMIERRFPDDFKSVAGEVLHLAFGEEGGLSAEKKRKRYIRFAGELMPDHKPGEYLANRMQFLQIIDALADRFHGPTAADLQKEKILLSVCDGTSFYGPPRPRLLKEMDLVEQFRERMQEMIDRIARDTDIVGYLDEVRHYSIETHPRGMSDISSETLHSLHKQCFPVERFEHAPQGVELAYEDYSRLRLRGFDIDGEMPPALYPRIRLARIYWPRQVLCLKVSVPAPALHNIQKRPLTEQELAEAMRDYDPHPFAQFESEREYLAISFWRSAKERELRDTALRAAGYDPANIDWKALEDPLDREAVEGTEWHTFWQTINIDLHLIADELPEALRIGLGISEIKWAHWTDSPKELSAPQDDEIPGKEFNCTYWDEDSDFYAWFPSSVWSKSGEKTDLMLVSRGFQRNYSADLPPNAQGVVTSKSIEEEFDDDTPELLQQFRDDAQADRKRIAPPTGKGIWDLLTLPMSDWQEKHYDFPSRRHQDKKPPSLRSLFAAPLGWTPAPDGTLASAILRSLAYGEGDERLDMKVKQSVNDRIACLRQMKDRLALAYNTSLAKHGYGVEGTDAG